MVFPRGFCFDFVSQVHVEDDLEHLTQVFNKSHSLLPETIEHISQDEHISQMT